MWRGNQVLLVGQL
ncbi:hypothetical protein LINPERPRIM_LOCUS26282 [Linum perenne]